eukprot:CAMPEP_0173105352 /NCGR_PEP_ID=MMETSP1102-20130122/40051_1 /TAXON_ID=49646 /ORGANISM="Geminigera sp., Strain Caron Lab Isolate" /LENGTH=86 /DNA_ID=CAMNT_0014001575 /DNA_START=118 /DNA_END=374 /DNA_ORIENTATION=+
MIAGGRDEGREVGGAGGGGGGGAKDASVFQDAQVYTWGNNGSGQLGLGHTARMLLPTAVPFPKVAGSTGEDSANGSGRQGGSGGSG